MYDSIIIGAGIAGSTTARKLAEEKNKKVLVIERRSHIGGNCYDKPVRTKTGATITIRGNCFGKYAGKEVITVKPARNSMGFVITSMRYYRAGK